MCTIQLAEDSEDAENDPAVVVVDSDSNLSEGENVQQPSIPDVELSLHSLSSVRHPSTMRTTAHINKKEVSLLIDNGSLHNFINSNTMQRVRLKCLATKPFEVKVANGEKLACQAIAKQVSIQVQGIKVAADLHV